MLYEFRVRNYKSFKDELCFSMRPAPKQKGLDYSILHRKVGRKDTKALSSAVIYGANASGKTNIISAMGVFQSIVLAGHIRNEARIGCPANIAANALELIPNCNNTTSTPVSFFIEFYHAKKAFSYSLEIDLGLFLENSHKRSILKEELIVNGSPVFIREKQTVRCDNFKKNGKSLTQEEAKLSKKLITNSLQADELFLSNGFKSIVSPTLANEVIEWFKTQFIIICHAELMTVSPAPGNDPNKPIPLPEEFRKAMSNFGVTGDNLCYLASPDKPGAELCSCIPNPNDKNKGNLINASVFESYGTIRFAQLYPLLERAMSTGATLVIDEFDASIHPMALLNIVNIFHNDEINKNGAQLIFNTHNPIFLNPNVFRRDEIKFVERNSETLESTHYSLSDFGTSGVRGVRKQEDYMKNYFIDRYGAISPIDFSDVFKKIVSSSGDLGIDDAS